MNRARVWGEKVGQGASVARTSLEVRGLSP